MGRRGGKKRRRDASGGRDTKNGNSNHDDYENTHGNKRTKDCGLSKDQTSMTTTAKCSTTAIPQEEQIHRGNDSDPVNDDQGDDDDNNEDKHDPMMSTSEGKKESSLFQEDKNTKATIQVSLWNNMHLNYETSHDEQNTRTHSSKWIYDNIDLTIIPEPYGWSESTSELQFLSKKDISSTLINNVSFEQVQTIWKSLVRASMKKNNKKKFKSDSVTKSVSWSSPTPIQLYAWSILLSYYPPKNKWSLIQIAPTGSGKTLAYSLPAILRVVSNNDNEDDHNHDDDNNKNGNYNDRCKKSILILVPTRELVLQVQKQIQLILKCYYNRQSKNDNDDQRTKQRIATAKQDQTIINVVACYGGISKQQQEQEILQSSNSCCTTVIVVGTPGRILDLVSNNSNKDNNTDRQKNDENNRHIISDSSISSHKIICSRIFNNLSMIVLDEADRLAINTDLEQQVSSIFEQIKLMQVRESLQVVLCSATWPKDKVDNMWNKWITHSSLPCAIIQVDAMSLVTSMARMGQRTKNQVHEENQTINAKEDHGIKNNYVDQHVESDIGVGKVENYVAASSHDQIRKENDHSKKTNMLLFAKIPSHITQILHVCSEHKKPRKLINTIQVIQQQYKDKRNVPLGIVFCSQIKTVQFVTKTLIKALSTNSNSNDSTNRSKIKCVQLHSHLRQSVREQVIRDFSCGKIPLLIATDIASRGIHVNNIQYIINYDFPTNLEQYVHRCGRAGRGVVVSVDVNTNSGAAGSREQTQLNPAQPKSNNGIIYSFFTRNLSPLARDVIELLESTKQWIDPNLRLLVNQASKELIQKTNKKDKDSQEVSKQRQNESILNEPSSPKIKFSDFFKGRSRNDSIRGENESDPAGYDDYSGSLSSTDLSPRRIVLKRASNVSDASSDSSDSENQSDLE